MDRRSQYNKKGLYCGYDKNNKERAALDYYSTPTEEVLNILQTLNIDFSNQTILEPCAGAGHMVAGIEDFLSLKGNNSNILATDIQNRGQICNSKIFSGNDYDFLSDNYPFTKVDYIIMNPPYSVIEPFTMKALSIAEQGVIMLGRLQFLEGEKRYKNIFQNFPPTDVYVYVDRIACYKNGDTQTKGQSAQAYAWFYWNFRKEKKVTEIHFLRRNDKK